jgi:hypothetical protein
LTLQSLEIILSALVIVYLVINSWKYGIRERKFCQSYFLLVFYIVAFATMVMSIGYGSVGIIHSRLWEGHFEGYNYDDFL